MKTSHFTLIFLFLIPCALTGQQGLYLDVGYLRSSIQTESSGVGARSGYFLGLHYNEEVAPSVEASSSLQYSAKGAMLANTSEAHPFLDALFTLGYKPVQEMSLFGGVSVGKLLTSNDQLFLERELDYGILAGVKYDFDAVILKMHYYRGLLNQQPSDLTSPSYLNNIQIGLGLKLNLKPGPPLADTMIVSTLAAEKPIVLPEIDTVDLIKRRFEIGLKLTDFSQFDAIVKRKIAPKRFVRFGLVIANAFFQNGTFQDEFSMNLGLNLGLEKRIRLDSKTHFSHGIQVGTLLQYDWLGEETVWSPNLGYLLGIQYLLSDRVGIGIEVTPTVVYSRLEAFQFGFSSTNVGLVFNYNFDSRK